MGRPPGIPNRPRAINDPWPLLSCSFLFPFETSPEAAAAIRADAQRLCDQIDREALAALKERRAIEGFAPDL